MTLSVLLLVGSWTTVWAEDEALPVGQAAESTQALDALLLDHAVLSESELEGERAKAALEIDRVVINDQDLNGTVTGNTASNTVTGDNAIAGDAFVGTSGFISSVQNTGNNVLIQTATIVNIEVQP